MRSLLLTSFNLSVYQSVTFMYYIQTTKDIVELLSRPVAYHSSLLRPYGVTQFQGESASRGVKSRLRENWQFSTEIAVYLENTTR